MMHKLLGGDSIGDVGFAEFRWQRPIHGEDSSHLLQFGEAHIELEG